MGAEGKETVKEQGSSVSGKNGFLLLRENGAVINFGVNLLESDAGHFVPHGDGVGDGGHVTILGQERGGEVVEFSLERVDEFGRKKMREGGG